MKTKEVDFNFSLKVKKKKMLKIVDAVGEVYFARSQKPFDQIA